jgi:hypothetical protein
VQTFEEWVKALREWEALPDVNPEPVDIATIKNGDRFRENGNVYLARSHALPLGSNVYLSVRTNDWTKREMSWPKGTIVERVGKEVMPPFPEWKYGAGKTWPT